MIDKFHKEKSDFLGKKDKSKKGSIDRDAVEIVNELNSKPDYYTTSSCSGRIVLLEMRSKKKNECDWVFSKHDKVNLKEILDSLAHYGNKFQSRIKRPLNASKKEETRFGKSPKNIEFIGEAERVAGQRSRALKFAEGGLNKSSIPKNPIWFKQQPIILHVACRNLECAMRLVGNARNVFKHSSILSITDRKVTVEIIGNEKLETIVADKGFVADEKYIRHLVKYSNKNFWENKRKSERFLSAIKKL